LISIITPFYNSEDYIKQSIDSVLSQTIDNWELLLINDGSTDSSKIIVDSINDSRIHYFEQENKGVAAARNVGLAHMRGDYFCFLDADDYLPPDGLSARLQVFEHNPEVHFVDGRVNRMDANLTRFESIWKPNFKGNPLQDLAQLTGKSFFGPTWMVKRNKYENYRMQEGLTHGEDLLFYMQLAKEGGVYDFTPEIVLHYRNNPVSAMKNLSGLEKGYRYIESEIVNWSELTAKSLWMYRIKYRKAMFLAYLKNKKIQKALHALC